ncbi:MAG: endonuclease III [Papillibacter sp.]|jgi:endonuclease-3|nr:endonuclease III [Papillibacter sp.]
MINSEYINKIIVLLEAEYPEALCSLDYATDWQLLFATRLAAQCTDERVNMVTPTLYSRYPTLEALAEAELSELEDIIHSCGFYHSKAKDIIAASKMLLSDYNGVVPGTMEELLKLPGVGRKTANIILGDVYKKPAVVTDTHCIRLANRMGLANSKDPYKVELSLRELIPEDKQTDFCHRLVLHGRKYCTARKPDCEHCPLRDVCIKKL